MFLRTADPVLPEDRVVVFPFENLTGDPELDDRGHIAALHIFDGLNQARDVRVVPSNFVLQEVRSRGLGASFQEIAEGFQAGRMVTGTITSLGDDLEYRAEIIRVTTGEVEYNVPARGPSAPGQEMVGLEDVRQRIMGTLSVSPDDVIARAVTGAARYDALDVLLDATWAFLDLDYERAAPLFWEAFEKDTTFFPPLIEALASNFNMRRWAAADSIVALLEKRKDRLGPIEIHSLEGLSAGIRGNHKDAYESAAAAFPYDSLNRGYFLAMYCVQVGRIEEALEALKSVDYEVGFFAEWPPVWWISSWANQLAGRNREGLAFADEGVRKFPEYLVLWRFEARALAALGRMDEFHPLLDQIQNVAPGTPEHEGGTFSPGSVFRALSVDLSRMGQQERARPLAERSLNWFQARGDDTYRQELGEALLLTGRNDDALDHFRALVQEAPDSIAAHGAFGVALARTGDREGAEAEAAWLKDLDRPYLRGENTLWRARIMAQLNETDASVELIHQALSEGRLYYFLLSDFYFTPLWEYEPFEEILRPRD